MKSVIHHVPVWQSVHPGVRKNPRIRKQRKPWRGLGGRIQACSYSPCSDGVYVKFKKLKEEKTVWSRVWASTLRGLIYFLVSSNYSPGLKFGLTLRRWTERMRRGGGVEIWGEGDDEGAEVGTLSPYARSEIAAGLGMGAESDTLIQSGLIWPWQKWGSVPGRPCVRQSSRPSSPSFTPSPSSTSPSV